MAQEEKLAAEVSTAASDIGSFIRASARAAQVSVRQLAEKAGVSNPYLSQIERGLRKPSADVLNQVAKALRVSAEVLYVQAGMLEPSDEERGPRRHHHRHGDHRAAEADPAGHLHVFRPTERSCPGGDCNLHRPLIQPCLARD